MNIWLSELFNILLVIAEFFIYFIFSGTFFKSKRSIRFRICSTLIFFICNYIIIHFLQLVTLRQLYSLTAFILFTLCYYQSAVSSAIFCSLGALSVIDVADVVVVYGFSSITGHNPSELSGLPLVYYLLSYTAKFLELLIVILIHIWGKNHRQQTSHKLLSYLQFGTYPLATFISSLLMYYAAVQAPQTAPFLLFCVILLLVTDIGALFLLQLFEHQQQQLTNQQILQHQLDTSMEQITSAMQSYENERRLTHDFQNQLTVILGMLDEQNNADKITDYIRQISSYTRASRLPFSTSRTAIDILLNQKYQIALNHEIDFHLSLDNLENFPLPDNMAVVLLANLLDNAIEACDKISDSKKRKIDLTIKETDQEFLINLTNTTAFPVSVQNGIITTSKRDKQKHGYGLKNIITIIHTYHGMYTLNPVGTQFQFAIIFPKLKKNPPQTDRS